MHQSEFSFLWRWVWPRLLYAPIRVQFLVEMGGAKVPICTNQSSVSGGDGHDQGFHVHYLKFCLC